MGYVEIVNLVFEILFGLYTIFMVHFMVFFIVGVFKKKRYPKTDVKNSYGIIIPARNEERVIGNLIESINKTTYPKDKLQIFVMAHNCTDNTAEVARKLGAKVYEYSNPNECTKGYGLKYIFEQIEKDYGITHFDGYFILDSDNIVAEDYFDKMNDAFEYSGKKNIVTSFRNSKNFGDNLISGLSSLYFTIGCVFESRPRSVCKCSTRVSGTGYVIGSQAIKDGWKYVTLTEDWELTADQIIEGNKILYCDEAVFYDEQPRSLKIMWRQRVRWSKGHLLVFKSRTKDIFATLINPHKRRKFSLYDLLTNIFPFCLILMGLRIVQLLLMFMGPIFSSDVTLGNIFLGLGENGTQAGTFGYFVSQFIPGGEDTMIQVFGPWFKLLFSNGYLYTLARSVILMYTGCILWALLFFILEHKRVKNISFFKKLLVAFFWPLFLLIQFPIDIQALFTRNLGWKVIPHESDTTINNLK